MSRTKFFIYFGGGFPLYTFGTAKPNVPCDVIPKRERNIREAGNKTSEERDVEKVLPLLSFFPFLNDVTSHFFLCQPIIIIEVSIQIFTMQYSGLVIMFKCHY